MDFDEVIYIGKQVIYVRFLISLGSLSCFLIGLSMVFIELIY